MAGAKDENRWLEAYRRIRKRMPPPTKVKTGKKGKGVPYTRKGRGEDGRREGEAP